MAVTINTQILGQEASSTPTYCYLYEPLRIVLEEDDLLAQKFYIDLEILDLTDNTVVVEDLFQYGDFDINPGQKLSVDLMKLARQYHDARVYRYSHINEIVEDSKGWNSSVSKYIYNFKIYSDTNMVPQFVKKVPIIGVRAYPDFVPTVPQAQKLTEAEVFGVDLDNRWLSYPFLVSTLGDLSQQDGKPSILKGISTSGRVPCGGMIVWKSRLGGWMVWGMDIKTEKQKGKYQNNLQSGMFEATEEIDGQPYIEADYTEISTSYSITLKSLSLSMAELRAVSHLQASPAVYYMKDNTGSLELMRLSSVSAPISNQANGGDFSVSLNSISTSSQKTR